MLFEGRMDEYVSNEKKNEKKARPDIAPCKQNKKLFK